jgi:hypothetical protein
MPLGWLNPEQLVALAQKAIVLSEEVRPALEELVARVHGLHAGRTGSAPSCAATVPVALC